LDQTGLPLARHSQLYFQLQRAWIRMRRRTRRLNQSQALWHSDNIFNKIERHCCTLKIIADGNLADDSLFARLRFNRWNERVATWAGGFSAGFRLQRGTSTILLVTGTAAAHALFTSGSTRDWTWRKPPCGPICMKTIFKTASLRFVFRSAHTNIKLVIIVLFEYGRYPNSAFFVFRKQASLQIYIFYSFINVYSEMGLGKKFINIKLDLSRIQMQGAHRITVARSYIHVVINTY